MGKQAGQTHVFCLQTAYLISEMKKVRLQGRMRLGVVELAVGWQQETSLRAPGWVTLDKCSWVSVPSLHSSLTQQVSIEGLRCVKTRARGGMSECTEFGDHKIHF